MNKKQTHKIPNWGTNFVLRGYVFVAFQNFPVAFLPPLILGPEKITPFRPGSMEFQEHQNWVQEGRDFFFVCPCRPQKACCENFRFLFNREHTQRTYPPKRSLMEAWVIGLMVWFLLWVQEVASSILASPLLFLCLGDWSSGMILA